jgi:hypothetical protein
MIASIKLARVHISLRISSQLKTAFTAAFGL